MPRRSPEYMRGQRLRFCEAAMTCFRRAGVTSTNLIDVCSETGLSMGALYKQFRSREDLLEAVLQLWLTRRNELLQGERWTDLKAGLLRYVQEVNRDRFWHEFQGVVDWNERLTELRVREAVVVLDQLEEQLRRYAAVGEIAPVFDLRRTAHLLSLIIDGSFLSVRTSKQLHVENDDLAGYLDFAVGVTGHVAKDKTEIMLSGAGIGFQAGEPAIEQ